MNHAERLGFFKTLYEAGAFLVSANKGKSPMRKLSVTTVVTDDNGAAVVGADGKVVTTSEKKRDDWNVLESHILSGGHVLYYQPAAQGILVLDFDPMIDEWVEAVADDIGADPLEQWKSSGKYKPPVGDKPGGYGGHAGWKTEIGKGTMLRQFAWKRGGASIGQVFSNHPGFGFIVYDPEALVNIMEADEIECVDASNILSGTSTFKTTSGMGWNRKWTPDPESRHDSTMSIIASSARECVERDDFEMRLESIRLQFIGSVSGDKSRSGDPDQEFDRLEEKGWEHWNNDRKRERITTQIPDDGDDLLIAMQSVPPVFICLEASGDEEAATHPSEEDARKIEEMDEEIKSAKQAVVDATAHLDEKRRCADDAQKKMDEYKAQENKAKMDLADQCDEFDKKRARSTLKDVSGARKAAADLLNTAVQEQNESASSLQSSKDSLNALIRLREDLTGEKSNNDLFALKPEYEELWASVANNTEWHATRDCIMSIFESWWDMSTMPENSNTDDARTTISNAAFRACMKAATNYDMSDEESTKEVLSILRAGRMAGIDASACCEMMSASNKKRREGRMRPRRGGVPNARQRLRGAWRSSAKDAALLVKKFGGTLIHGRVESDPQDVMMLLRACGLESQFSYLDAGFVITHPGLRGWQEPNEFTTLLAPEYDHLQRVRNAIRQSCMKIEVHPSEKDGDFIYAISPAVESGWCTGKTMLNHLYALKGGAIPIVDVLEEWTRGIIARHASMDPSDLEYCVDLAANLFLRIPGVKPAAGHEDIAIAASRIVYPSFMMRRLQSLPDYARGVQAQRYVPVLGGGGGVGKTTIANCLIPHSGGVEGEKGARALLEHGAFEGRVNSSFSFNTDINECLRQMRGNVFTINDELAGLGESNVNSVKSVITFRTGKSHAKYENYKEMKRTDIMVGTTNESDSIPKNAPMRDRLLAFRMERQDGTESGDSVYARINDWFSSNYTALFVGGLELALRVRNGTFSIHPSSGLDLTRGDALENLSSDTQHVSDTIKGMVSNGTAVSWVDQKTGDKLISVERVALFMNRLKYGNDVKIEVDEHGVTKIVTLWRAGETIDPAHRSPEDEDGTIDHYGNEFSPWTEMAIKSSGSQKEMKMFKGQVKNVCETLFGCAPERRRVPVSVRNSWKTGPNAVCASELAALDVGQDAWRYVFKLPKSG